jgi:hypothetical protein
MLELVAGVEFRVIARAGLPHFPEDFLANVDRGCVERRRGSCRVCAAARSRRQPTDRIADSGSPADAQRGGAACCSVAGDRPCGSFQTGS